MNVVERQDMRTMSRSQINRFFDAVDTMMVSTNGPGTSDFYRIASYHGQPPPIYCDHARETFPGWHRIYLYEFEQALQKADRNNGNNGRIALPYWDYTSNIREGLPNIIYQRFKGWPNDFWPRNLRNVSQTQRLRRATDRQVAAQLSSWGVVRATYESLLNVEHYRHASTRFRSMYPSLEDPHNDVHVITGGNGGQMATVAWAAYDIIFWVFHCNVDRVYESYLRLEPDSHQEFREFQRRQRDNLYERGFEPFRKPNGQRFYPRDTFNTRNLGYYYHDLMSPPDQQLREPPVLLMFKNVKISNFESKCYQLHVFIHDKTKYVDDEKDAIQTIDDIDYDSDHYAGGVGIFGRGMECKNCMESPPRNIMIDITKTIKKLKISRYNAISRIYVLETTDDSNQLKTIHDTPLPQPFITGPLFENKDNDDIFDKRKRKKQNKNEIMALQRYLKKFGYYENNKKIDGDFGDYTETAVKDFQKATGILKNDGVVDKKTRERIINMKRCDNIDGFANNDVVDKDSDFNGSWYKGKYTFTYSIGIIPGYLKRDKVRECITKVCAQYSFGSNNILKFNEVESMENNVDIQFNWKHFKSDQDILQFDGPGGILGKGGNGFVDFDVMERWVIGLSDDDQKELSDIHDVTTWRRGQPTVSLYYTALHELGHTLGLDHSLNAKDVMSPWYNPKQIKLSKNDKKRLIQVAVYGKKAIGAHVNLDDDHHHDEVIFSV